MYTVLLPIDRDEQRATAQAEMIERIPDATEQVQVVMVHVFEDQSDADKTSPTQLVTGSAIRERFNDAGISFKTKSRSGDPAEEIVKTAEGVGADLVVLGGRKRSPLGSLLFGSVSQAVTLDSTRPVVITGDRAAE